MLMEKDSLPKEVILLLDEMYLRKSVPYSLGQFIGADEKGAPFKGIMVFMISFHFIKGFLKLSFSCAER